ncbi:MAG: hypothetical protein ACI4TW_08860 [Prevotella sp.]
MATQKNQERLRYRYGLCLNDSCTKAKAKEVQQIPARKDFVCAECGKALKECPPPKTWMQKNGKVLYSGIGAVVVAVGVILGISLSGGSSQPADETPIETPAPQVTDTLKKDTVATKETATHEAAAQPEADDTKKGGQEPDVVSPKPKKAAGHAPGERYQGTLNLSYGTYSGEIVDGKPDGAGTLRYTTTQKVVSSKDVMAESGDRIEGVFENGKPTFVTLYKKDGSTIKVHR